MKTEEIFRKAGSILSEINEQYNYLSSAPESLNDLEIELLSANADFFAEHVKVLKKLNTASENKASANTAVYPSAEPQADETIASEETTDSDVHDSGDLESASQSPESYFSFDDSNSENDTGIQVPVETGEEPESIPEEVIKLEDENIEPAGAMSFDKVETESSDLGDFRPLNQGFVEHQGTSEEAAAESGSSTLHNASEPERVPTLNELIASQRASDSAPGRFNRQPQPVSDLKAIINLNDKLLFIKDLFNGYSLAYSEAIEILNRFDTFDAADNFLKTNYAAKNNWAAKQGTADKFYEILNRRFSK